MIIIKKTKKYLYKFILSFFLILFSGCFINTINSYAETIYVPYGSSTEISFGDGDEKTSKVRVKAFYVDQNGRDRSFNSSHSEGTLVTYDKWDTGWHKDYVYSKNIYKSVTSSGCSGIDFYKYCEKSVDYEKGDGHSYYYWNELYANVKNVTGTVNINFESYYSDKSYSIVACSSHTFKDSYDRNPSCTVTGILRRTCTRCAYAYTENVPALGHAWPGGWSGQDTNNHWKNCTRCGTRIQTASHYDNNKDGCCDACGRDIQGPVITRRTFVVDSGGYWCYAYVTDNRSGVNRVQYPSWTDFNGQDDIFPTWWTNPAAKGTSGSWNINGQTYNNRYYVAKSAHNYEFGPYNTHIYAYDNTGNQSTSIIYPVYMDNTAPIIDYSTYIVDENGVDVYVHAYDPGTANSGIARLGVWVWNSNIGDYTTGKNFNITNAGNWTINNKSYNYHYRVNKADYKNFNTGYYSDVRAYDRNENHNNVWNGTGSAMSTLNNVGLTSRLTFNANGGTVNGSGIYTVNWVIGSMQTSPTPVRPGYVFKGWTGWTGKVPSTNTTYTAQWETARVKILLDLNKPSASKLNPTSSKLYIYSRYLSSYDALETLPTPTLQDWKFDGWYTSAVDGALVNGKTTVMNYNQHTLYAHWRPIVPSIITDLTDEKVIEYIGLSDTEYLQLHGIEEENDKTLDYKYAETELKLVSDGGMHNNGKTSRATWYYSLNGTSWQSMPESGLLTFSDGTVFEIENDQTGQSNISKLKYLSVGRKVNQVKAYCKIENNAGSIQSKTATLTVYWLPKIN